MTAMNVEASTQKNDTPLAERIASGFEKALEPNFVLQQLEKHPASIFGLHPDGRLAYVNPAWVRFARENGAPTSDAARAWIGQQYLDVIADPLKPFYSRLFQRTPEEGSAMHPVSHVYECSTPDTFRQFVMKVYALPRGEGFVVINSLIASRPHGMSKGEPQPPNRALYQSADGLILQCSHCRLVRRADKSRWDWVPAWVEQMPAGTSHGICEVCFECYYPDDENW
jgi:hypothetical protein